MSADAAIQGELREPAPRLPTPSDPAAHAITQRPSRLAGIDGLRALAASAIVANHTWYYSGDGRVGGYWTALVFNNLALGVTLFFALSGFLLYRPIAAAVLGGRPLPSVGRYLVNRGLRILPAYWVILAVCGLILGCVYTGWNGDYLTVGTLTDPLKLAQAATLTQGYRPNSLLLGIGPAWSLSVEVAFYVLLPLFGLAAARLARGGRGRRRVLAALAPPLALLALGLVGKAAAWRLVPGAADAGWRPSWHAVLERSFLAQADLFSFGMALAVLFVLCEQGTVRLPRHWRPPTLVFAFVLLAPSLRTFNGSQLSYLPQNTVVALALALVLAVVVLRGPGDGVSPLARVLSFGPLTAVGAASYSLFLWHEPVIDWLVAHGATLDGARGLIVNLVIVAVVSGVLSAITYRLVERPALARKRGTAIPAGQSQAAP